MSMAFPTQDFCILWLHEWKCSNLWSCSFLPNGNELNSHLAQPPPFFTIIPANASKGMDFFLMTLNGTSVILMLVLGCRLTLALLSNGTVLLSKEETP